MKTRTEIASTRCRAASVAIVFAMGLVCAGAQTTAKQTFPPDDVEVLTMPGPIPGPGLAVLVHHVTTCDRFVSQLPENGQTQNLSGCIRGAVKARGTIKVQIRGVNTSKSANTVANEFGEFLFNDVPAGDYVLLAAQGTTTLTLRALHFPLKMPLIVGDVFPHLPLVGTLYLSEY
jgi:hypothetical protein